jgi:hypothetical protein
MVSPMLSLEQERAQVRTVGCLTIAGKAMKGKMLPAIFMLKLTSVNFGEDHI